MYKVIINVLLLLGCLSSQMNAMSPYAVARHVKEFEQEMESFNPYDANKNMWQKVTAVSQGLCELTKKSYSLSSRSFGLDELAFIGGIGLLSGASVLGLHDVTSFLAIGFNQCNAQTTVSFTVGATAGLAGACYALRYIALHKLA